MTADAPPADLLVVCPLLPSLMADLERAYTCHRLYEAPDREAFLAAAAPRVRAIATAGHAGADAALIDALPKLEIIANFGVGVDMVDLEHAERRGVIVTNTPDVLTEDVADLAMALITCVARGIVSGDRYVRAGRWEPEGPMPLMRSVGASTIGIVGMGRIGRAVARRAEATGAKIAYFSRQAKDDLPYPFVADLIDLAAASDYLVLCAPGGAGTRHMVDRPVLDALGPTGAVINIGRGSLIDEAALLAALLDGRVGGAGLDVFEDEPRVTPGLTGLEQVVLVPHIGSATHETRRAMGEMVAANLAAHFAGQPLPSRVV
jgi:lactate dehydrogenase-like 2-hydroxyacid dehydrogenase